MARFTIFVTYKKTDDVNGDIVIDYDEDGQLSEELERRHISLFNIVGEMRLRYNGHMGQPISMAQCFAEGDFGPTGVMH
jgi:hypothetical protein